MSDNTYIIFIISSLVIASGVIAYVGDVLGSYIGKKRLSLFGTRPKRTGQIIGIGAGVAITLVTLGVSALVFRGAVRTIFNAQAVSQQVEELKVQEKNLQQQVQALEQQKAETQDALETANATIKIAESERDQAIKDRDEAREGVTALETQRNNLQAESDKLETTLATLQEQFTQANGKLADAQEELASIEDELKSADQQRDRALAEAEQAKAEAANATTEVAELKNQIGNVQTNLESKIAELQVQTEALLVAQTNLETAQANLQTAQTELVTAQRDRDEALRDRNAATAQIESLQATRDTLNDSLQTIQRDVKNYEQLVEDLRAQKDSLTAQNQELLEQSATLKTSNDTLKTQNESLTNDIRIQNEQADLLKGQIAGLNEQLEEQARELDIITEQMDAVASGELTYKINEAIHSGVISSQDPIEIRSELAQLFLAADNKTTESGAGKIESRTEQIEILVQAISESPNADIVTFRSPYNQYKGAPVTVDVEAIENQRLVGRGQLVVSRQIHLGSELLPITSDQVSEGVRELWRDANDKLLSLGLADNVDTSTSDGSSLSPEAFSNELERLTGVVTIGLVATEEVYSSGPVRLSLMIIN